MALDGTASVQAKAYLGSKENQLLVPNSEFGRRKYVNVRISGSSSKSSEKLATSLQTEGTVVDGNTLIMSKKGELYTSLISIV